MNLLRSRFFFWLLGLCGLVVSVAGATWVLGLGSRSPEPTPEAAAPAEPERVVSIGYVDVPSGVQALFPLQQGRVVEIPNNVREGEAVKAGQVLLRLDDELAQLRLREARADLEAAQAQLTQARHLPAQQEARQEQQKAAIEATRRRLAAARLALQRKRELEKIKQLSPEEAAAALELVNELEAAERAELAKLKELDLVDPQVGLTRAEASVQAAQARVAQAQKAIDECVLRAPTDGEILRLLASPGDVITAQAKQAPILFCPDEPRIVRAEVEQEFAPRVAVGMKALVRDDIKGEATWTGKVTRLSDWFTHRRSIIQEPLVFNDVRTLECIVELDPGQPRLRIGQRVRVTIPAE